MNILGYNNQDYYDCREYKRIHWARLYKNFSLNVKQKMVQG